MFKDSFRTGSAHLDLNIGSMAADLHLQKVGVISIEKPKISIEKSFFLSQFYCIPKA